MPRIIACQGCGKPFRADRRRRRYCTLRCMTARGAWAFYPERSRGDQPKAVSP